MGLLEIKGPDKVQPRDSIGRVKKIAKKEKRTEDRKKNKKI
jgi:hypothetical protein